MPVQSALPIAQLSPSDLIFISDANELVTDSLMVSKHLSKRVVVKDIFYFSVKYCFITV
ncbi:hypothetical protein [Photobacterium phosphoreum]|uniref:hypothetical protein n=1 Tax=Photobacterium phosphoreum TaxID=659 RepID=UPI0015E73574|nr:hypothetical protein [Photobacterium phosphoreum]